MTNKKTDPQPEVKMHHGLTSIVAKAVLLIGSGAVLVFLCNIIIIVAMVQFLCYMLLGSPNSRLLEVTEYLEAYVKQLVEYLHLRSDVPPWPFSALPSSDKPSQSAAAGVSEPIVTEAVATPATKPKAKPKSAPKSAPKAAAKPKTAAKRKPAAKKATATTRKKKAPTTDTNDNQDAS